MAFTPYTFMLNTVSGKEIKLFTITGELGLSDADAKTAALVVLNDIVGKLTDATPDSIVVKNDIIAPVQFNIRLATRQDDIS